MRSGGLKICKLRSTQLGTSKNATMLADKQLKAFVPTVMRQEAKAFYKDILGLRLVSEDDYALEFEAGGTLLRVISVKEFKPHPFTAVGWNVSDIVSTIKCLNEKAVFCEKYEFLDQDN